MFSLGWLALTTLPEQEILVLAWYECNQLLVADFLTKRMCKGRSAYGLSQSLTGPASASFSLTQAIRFRIACVQHIIQKLWTNARG